MAKWNIWKRITEIISKNKTWLYEKRNAVIVLCAGAASAFLFWIIHEFVIEKNQNISSGAWNLIILIVSSPVAFAIWHFRDKNNRQQIENQRKDINLKEFQKLSEWVSGAHLPEIKTVSKTTQKSSSKDGAEIIEQTTELSEEYAKKPNTADFDTFSKRDGAIALQISAIYNLLPFFRGDHGESFRRPAFNLLKSAWQAMQQDSLKKLDEGNLFYLEREKIFDELQQRAESPMGVALTQVLLSLNRENKKLNLRDFPEMLPNICLAGMDFHLSGVSEIARDLSGLKLHGVDFRGIMLVGGKLQGCHLMQAKLDGADLSKTELQNADLFQSKLREVDMGKAQLQGARLAEADLQSTYLGEANLQDATLSYAKLEYADLSYAKLEYADLSCANLENTNFSHADLQYSDLRKTKMSRTSLQNANLQNARLNYADAQNANFLYTNLKACDFKWEQLKNNKELLFAEITIYDFIRKIYPDWKKENDLEWEALTEEDQTRAMQKFCDGTGMLIFDEDGEQQIMPPL
jgi:pentapeptide repeats protein